VVAALRRRFDAELAVFEADPPTPGEGDVEANLTHRFCNEIHGQDYGMRTTFGRVAAYLEAEQGLGRLGTFEVDAAVTTLVGSMMALGMSGMVTGRSEADSREQIRGIVATLLDGIGH
jgi:hypothetical protein